MVKNRILVMGDPVGKASDIKTALDQFVSECNTLDYNVIFYSVSQDCAVQLTNYGYKFIKIGEAASVPLQDFSLQGSKNKTKRNSVNKVEKEGFSFEVIQPPYSVELMAQLKDISDDWLGDRGEMSFSLGYFDYDYIQSCDLAIVKDADGQIVAFSNIMPSYTDKTRTIDLMRYKADKAPRGLMDYLFIKLFDYYKEQGMDAFDLGMAPMSNVGNKPSAFLRDRVLHLVYQSFNRVYSFQGLRHYKEKFQPNWSPLYISYSKHNWIAFVVLAMLDVSDVKSSMKN